jgi:hypothetical protein
VLAPVVGGTAASSTWVSDVTSGGGGGDDASVLSDVVGNTSSRGAVPNDPHAIAPVARPTATKKKTELGPRLFTDPRRSFAGPKNA